MEEILLEKLTVPQLAKKFPAFYGKFYYRIQKRRPPVPILSQINTVHAPSHFLNIQFNIILLSTPVPPKLSFSYNSPY